MKLTPYPKYEPSGVERLGDVPSHWEVKRGRFCVEVQPSSNRLRELPPDDEVSFVPMEAVREYGGLDLEQTRAVAERGSGYTEFEDGDVIVAKITPCFENGKGALASGLLNGAAIGTTELHVLRPKSNLDRRLLFYFTISPLFRTLGEGEMYGAGGQKRVPTSFCEDVPIPLAPLDEQRTIADFLDHQAAKIDTLIRKKQALIERLQEKRAALITHTVTRGLPPEAARATGLDPHPNLKPSGIEWLGDIPEHWEILPLRRWYRIVNGGTPSSTEDAYWDGGINWITPEDLGRNRSKRTGNSRRTLSREGLMNCGAQLVPVNSVVLSTRAPIGHLAVTSRESCTNQGCRTLVPKGSCTYPDYLYYALLASRPLLEAAGKGTTFMELSADLLGSHTVPFPPDSEQRTIADFLDRETAKIDGLIAKVDTAIARLREYRAALITAAVTGQVDVRGVIASESPDSVPSMRS